MKLLRGFPFELLDVWHSGNTMNSKKFIGCCGAYCKTCRAFINSHCKGCKLGFDTNERNSNRAKCRIKLCCFRDKGLTTCADCSQFASCNIIGCKLSRNKNQKYKEAIEFIKKNGYSEFIRIANNWKNNFGKLD